MAGLDGDDELLLVGLFGHEPDGELGAEHLGPAAGCVSDADEPHQWQVQFHGRAQPHVVGEVRVVPAPLVAEHAVLAHGVVVGALGVVRGVGGEDADGCGGVLLHPPDAGLRADQPMPPAVELELAELVAGEPLGDERSGPEPGEDRLPECHVVKSASRHGASLVRYLECLVRFRLEVPIENS